MENTTIDISDVIDEELMNEIRVSAGDGASASGDKAEDENVSFSNPDAIENAGLFAPLEPLNTIVTDNTSHRFEEPRGSDSALNLSTTLEQQQGQNLGQMIAPQFNLSRMLQMSSLGGTEFKAQGALESSEMESVIGKSTSLATKPPSYFMPIESAPTNLILFGNNGNNILRGGIYDDVLYGNRLGAVDPFVPLYTINSPTAMSGDAFGQNTFIYGDQLIVSNDGHDGSFNNEGIIYVYDLHSGILNGVLNNPTPAQLDAFGRNVKIADNYLFVSVEKDDTGATDAGSVYVYDLDTLSLLYTWNNPTPANYDGFGGGDIASDGTLAIVGARNDDTGATNAGEAYIYDVATGNLLHTLVNPNPISNGYFGSKPVIDGDYAVVLAYGNELAYIYDTNTGNLLHTISNPDPALYRVFPEDAAIYGTTVIITGWGGPAALAFDMVTGNLLYTLESGWPDLYNAFGEQIHVDEHYTVITASEASRYDGYSGSTGRVFVYETQTGDLLYELENPTPEDWEYFGGEMYVKDNYLFVDSGDNVDGDYEGSLYIFDLTTGNLVSTLRTEWLWYYNQSPLSYDNGMFVLGNPWEDTGTVEVYNMDYVDSDILYGGAGNDILYGLNGADYLYGGAGADSLYGGTNSDRFIFVADTAFDGIDRIEDFNVTEGDVIDISNVLSGFTLGVDDVVDFARFIDDGADAILEIDIDGAANGVNFEAIAFVVGGAGFNADDLESRGLLDIMLETTPA